MNIYKYDVLYLYYIYRYVYTHTHTQHTHTRWYFFHTWTRTIDDLPRAFSARYVHTEHTPVCRRDVVDIIAHDFFIPRFLDPLQNTKVLLRIDFSSTDLEAQNDPFTTVWSLPRWLARQHVVSLRLIRINVCLEQKFCSFVCVFSRFAARQISRELNENSKCHFLCRVETNAMLRKSAIFRISSSIFMMRWFRFIFRVIHALAIIYYKVFQVLRTYQSASRKFRLYVCATSFQVCLTH